MTLRRPSLPAALPPWATAGARVLATLAACGGTALLTLAVIFGDPPRAIWGGVAFAVAGGLWHVADAGPDRSF